MRRRHFDDSTIGYDLDVGMQVELLSGSIRNGRAKRYPRVRHSHDRSQTTVSEPTHCCRFGSSTQGS
jgi:hypothetical protein